MPQCAEERAGLGRLTAHRSAAAGPHMRTPRSARSRRSIHHDTLWEQSEELGRVRHDLHNAQEGERQQ